MYSKNEAISKCISADPHDSIIEDVAGIILNNVDLVHRAEVLKKISLVVKDSSFSRLQDMQKQAEDTMQLISTVTRSWESL